jgi:2,4'-dihydroxyacetophenone dioxygenase
MTPSTITKITAAPCTAYKVVNRPEAYADVIQKHGIQGRFVGSSERESPWVPFGSQAAIRHYI